jgi:hypothetical protein
MVMRNRSNGNDSPHWWDDLPPKVRNRVARPVSSLARTENPTAEFPEPLSRGALVRDLSSLAALFALVALGIMLYLIVAVTFVTG